MFSVPFYSNGVFSRQLLRSDPKPRPDGLLSHRPDSASLPAPVQPPAPTSRPCLCFCSEVLALNTGARVWMLSVGTDALGSCRSRDAEPWNRVSRAGRLRRARATEGQRGTRELWGAMDVYYLDGDSGDTGVSICPNSSDRVLQMCTGFCRSIIPAIIVSCFFKKARSQLGWNVKKRKS